MTQILEALRGRRAEQLSRAVIFALALVALAITVPA